MKLTRVACWRMVGADHAAFECGSCSEFQMEFAVSRTDSAQDDCQFARANDFAVGADASVGVRHILRHVGPCCTAGQTM